MSTRRGTASAEQVERLVATILRSGTLVHWSHDSEDDDTYIYVNAPNDLCMSLRSDGGFFYFTLGARYENGGLRGSSASTIELSARYGTLTPEREKELVKMIFDRFMPEGWGKLMSDEVERKLRAATGGKAELAIGVPCNDAPSATAGGGILWAFLGGVALAVACFFAVF